jgi:hypothetical protein
MFPVLAVLGVASVGVMHTISKEKCISKCTEAHSENGDNYEWLLQLNHGQVKKIEFQEPIRANEEGFRNYTDTIWKIHCKVVGHGKDLVKNHVKAFIDPQTRFARLRFTFEDGTVMEPTVEFYQLEKEYFKRRKLCQ